jgi:hypothetical protein
MTGITKLNNGCATRFTVLLDGQEVEFSGE